MYFSGLSASQVDIIQYELLPHVCSRGSGMAFMSERQSESMNPPQATTLQMRRIFMRRSRSLIVALTLRLRSKELMMTLSIRSSSLSLRKKTKTTNLRTSFEMLYLQTISQKKMARRLTVSQARLLVRQCRRMIAGAFWSCPSMQKLVFRLTKMSRMKMAITGQLIVMKKVQLPER